MATQLAELIPGSNLDKIETAFGLPNYDDIFSYLTSSGVNGPELLSLTTNLNQDLFIRLYSAIASAPIEKNSLEDGRAELIQSVLDLIEPGNTPLPNRLSDKLNDIYLAKTAQLELCLNYPLGLLCPRRV